MIITEAKHADVFMNKTRVPFYDCILNNDKLNNSDYTESEYFRFEKGIQGKIVPMTAKQYIMKCAEVYESDYEGALKGVRWDKVDKYAEDMKNGDKFPLPYLMFHPDYGNAQEGRHRMLAMSKAYGEDAIANVLVCELTKATEEEKMDYAMKKYPRDPQWVINSIINPALRIKGNSTEDSVDDEPEYEVITIQGIDISRGDIIDYGDGWVEVTSTHYNYKDDLMEVEGVLVDDEDEDILYYINDTEELKLRKDK